MVNERKREGTKYSMKKKYLSGRVLRARDSFDVDYRGALFFLIKLFYEPGMEKRMIAAVIQFVPL